LVSGSRGYQIWVPT